MISLSYLSKKENINLIETINLVDLMKKFNNAEYEIKYIKFLMIKSIIILIGKQK